MNNNRNTVIRTLHDVGAAAWFGGSLMGAVGLNGASQDVSDPRERTKIASAGWGRWAPVAAAAIGSHVIGGLGLVLSNRDRVMNQRGVGANTVVKTVLTGAAVIATAYSGALGGKVWQISEESDPVAEGGTIPSYATPEDLAKKQQQLRVLQWAIPALTGLIIALGSQQGEQQRPTEQLRGSVAKIKAKGKKKKERKLNVA
ncbi:MAG: hypothetical protein ACRCTR_06145 [Actinomycetota bacterium]